MNVNLNIDAKVVKVERSVNPEWGSSRVEERYFTISTNVEETKQKLKEKYENFSVRQDDENTLVLSHYYSMDRDEEFISAYFYDPVSI